VVSHRSQMPMIDDWLLSLLYAAWLTASTMPLGFMLGSSCSPCCENCPGSKPRTDPKDEGTWVPVVPWPDRTVSGNVFPYAGVGLNENWSFVEREVHGPGNTWFFFGSSSTSKVGGNATLEEQRDWGNLCNWYSAKSSAPPALLPLQIFQGLLTKRATLLPDEDAVIHVYSPISTASVGPQVVKNAYFWASPGVAMTTTDTEITATETILSTGFVSVGALFHFGQNWGVINGGASFIDPTPYSMPFTSATGGNGGNALNFPYTNSDGIVNGGALFCGAAFNWAVVNGGAEFITQFSANRSSQSDSSGSPGLRGGTGVVNGGAIFRGARNQGPTTPAVVNDGAMFFSFAAAAGGNLGVNGSNQGTINGGAEFFDSAANGRTINGGAVFNDTSTNGSVVNDGAVFNDASTNSFAGTINGGAEFFDQSKNAGGGFFFGTVRIGGIVNGGATFNDDACSEVFNTVNGVRIFRANFTDLPTCNGTAPPGSDATATCGCG
jgi:hypothetical protein